VYVTTANIACSARKCGMINDVHKSRVQEISDTLLYLTLINSTLKLYFIIVYLSVRIISSQVLH